MFNGCCAAWEVLFTVFLLVCCGPAVILLLPLSAHLTTSFLACWSLHYLHSCLSPVPCDSHRRSLDVLVPLHSPTIFRLSCSATPLLGRTWSHVKPNPTNWGCSLTSMESWAREAVLYLPGGLGAQWGQECGPGSSGTFFRAGACGCGACRVHRCGDTSLLGQEPALPGSHAILCTWCSWGMQPQLMTIYAHPCRLATGSGSPSLSINLNERVHLF